MPSIHPPCYSRERGREYKPTRRIVKCSHKYKSHNANTYNGNRVTVWRALHHPAYLNFVYCTSLSLGQILNILKNCWGKETYTFQTLKEKKNKRFPTTRDYYAIRFFHFNLKLCLTNPKLFLLHLTTSLTSFIAVLLVYWQAFIVQTLHVFNCCTV